MKTAEEVLREAAQGLFKEFNARMLDDYLDDRLTIGELTVLCAAGAKRNDYKGLYTLIQLYDSAGDVFR